VTHNPELTRYATRVVYMRDGAIVQDEATEPGEVAATARAELYRLPAKTEEDDLAGVSALMHALPQASAKLAKPAGHKKTSTKKSTKTRKPKTRKGRK
jgi:ABC-type cobalamin/Fe3+-siderophores transport system ATPase subunit